MRFSSVSHLHGRRLLAAPCREGCQRQYPPQDLSMARVPLLEEWKVLRNGQVTGIVKGHPDPDLDDGDTITTSPLANPDKAAAKATVITLSGSKYRLGEPIASKQQQKRNGKVAPAKKVIPPSKVCRTSNRREGGKGQGQDGRGARGTEKRTI